MKTATISELKKALQYKSREELLEYCLATARFKLETKELLTYLVFESEDESHYRESVKAVINSEFESINTTNYYYIKKGSRKILRQVKRFIRYSKNKETESELLIHFCEVLRKTAPRLKQNRVLRNMYMKQLEMASKAIAKLHPDLQYDINLKLESLPEFP